MRHAVFALLSLVAACGPGASSEGVMMGDCALVTDDLMPPVGATLKFMDDCRIGEDAKCETNLCFNFNARGLHCSAPCASDCECPPPSRGCSMMGVCKSP